MIDIHSHIVFDVDDGPKTREDTRAFIEEFIAKGCGPLFHHVAGMFETPKKKISWKFSMRYVMKIMTGRARFNDSLRQRFTFIVSLGCYPN